MTLREIRMKLGRYSFATDRLAMLATYERDIDRQLNMLEAIRILQNKVRNYLFELITAEYDLRRKL